MGRIPTSPSTIDTRARGALRVRMSRVRRALLSVSDKRGLVELARALAELDVELLSTGGTALALGQAGLKVTQVSAYTGAPEILDGRVKTLHPKIHGGLLGRPTADHEREMAANGIQPIDLVVVNLYPFEATVAKPDVSLADAIENIDIGGPSMLRSAAKNHERVTVVVDPDDHAAVGAAIGESGEAPRAPRLRPARKASAHTAAHDGAIAAWLTSIPEEGAAREPFPETLTLQWRRERPPRHGENPHQQAASHVEAGDLGKRPTLGRADVLQGKE